MQFIQYLTIPLNSSDWRKHLRK